MEAWPSAEADPLNRSQTPAPPGPAPIYLGRDRDLDGAFRHGCRLPGTRLLLSGPGADGNAFGILGVTEEGLGSGIYSCAASHPLHLLLVTEN